MKGLKRPRPRVRAFGLGVDVKPEPHPDSYERLLRETSSKYFAKATMPPSA